MVWGSLFYFLMEEDFMGFFYFEVSSYPLYYNVTWEKEKLCLQLPVLIAFDSVHQSILIDMHIMLYIFHLTLYCIIVSCRGDETDP